MASLGEVLGALISQIGKGRSQADMATVEVARVYKDHPLLSGFPVPRVTLDEVVVDLKMSITTAPAPAKFLGTKARSEVLAQVKDIVSNLMNAETSLISMSEKFPVLLKAWKSAQDQLIQKLSELFPSEAEVETRPIAYGAASVILGQLLSTILTPEAEIQTKTIREFLNKDFPQIENKLVSQIQEVLSKSLETQPQAKDRLDVLVTASDLQGIPPEKITTLKLTLRESDRTWTQIETEKGEIKDKLIPS